MHPLFYMKPYMWSGYHLEILKSRFVPWKWKFTEQDTADIVPIDRLRQWFNIQVREMGGNPFKAQGIHTHGACIRSQKDRLLWNHHIFAAAYNMGLKIHQIEGFRNLIHIRKYCLSFAGKLGFMPIMAYVHLNKVPAQAELLKELCVMKYTKTDPYLVAVLLALAQASQAAALRMEFNMSRDKKYRRQQRQEMLPRVRRPEYSYVWVEAPLKWFMIRAKVTRNHLAFLSCPRQSMLNGSDDLVIEMVKMGEEDVDKVVREMKSSYPLAEATSWVSDRSEDI